MVEAIHSQRHDRKILILYGSETGNSQDVAEQLGRIAERLRFINTVCEMDQVEIKSLSKHSVVIFVISTTGQGEFPRNARKLWKSLLRKRLPPGCLGHVKFTTFGLGDSSYAQFNWAARKLHKRLEQLGAQEIYPPGEADEQHAEGIDGTFLSWSIDLGKHLLSLHPLSEGESPIPPDVFLPPKHFLELVNIDLEEPDQLEPIFPTLTPISTSDAATSPDHPLATATPSVPFSASAQPQTTNGPGPDSGLASKHEGDPAKMDHTAMLQVEPRPCPQIRESIPGVPDPVDRVPPKARLLPWPNAVEAKLVSNVRITPADHWQDVRELTFHMDKETQYLPGDALTIYPKNFPEDVETLIDLMGWSKIADSRVSFQPTSPEFYHAKNLTSMVPGLYPAPRTTIRQLLTDHLDITAIPKRSFFEFISHQTSDPIHEERLSEFSNPAYTDEFFDYATRPRRSILEVLQDFPSVKIPWKWATSAFPVIRGRQYSISSGGNLKVCKRNKNVVQVQLLVAIVKYRTVLKKIRQGLCSRYIASLPENTIMNVGLTPGGSSFSNVAKYQPNYPVILIGPGTGLAPLRSLIWTRAALKMHDEALRAPTRLFYGGRNRNADFFYRDEWQDAQLGVIVHTAFSRDQKEKIYIQDIIRRDGKIVWGMLQKNAVVYVCGSSGNMPKAVREAIIDVMAEHGAFVDRAEAELAVGDMVKRGHYVQETW